MGGIFNAVSNVVENVGDFAGNVIETAVDNPIATAAVLIGAPYLAGELLAGELLAGEALAGGLGADLIAPEIAALGATGTSAGLGGIGAGLIAPEITALGTSLGANTFPSLDFINSIIPKTEEAAASTFGSSTAADIAAAEAASAAQYTGGTGLSQTLFGSTPVLTPAAIAEGAVPVATQGILGAGGTFNPLSGSLLSNIIPSTPTDFLTSFIPKTPADIAKTLGTSALLGAATNALIPKPAIAEVNMNIPQSNIPQYGTGQTIFNAYNSAKQGVNNILYPQGLLTTQPRTAGIYSNYLQQQGLI